jgi:hypothetical protein
MFKWACLAVATLFLSALGWMVNDVRLEIRRSTDLVRTTGQTVNEHLPTLVDRSRKATDTLAENLPEIVAKTKTTTETLAELAEDIRQLKELAGVSHTARDRNLVAYADSLLDAVEASGGTIGLKKTFGGSELKNAAPAKEWVSAARKEALVLTALAKSQKELANRLAKNKFGASWYVQVPGREPVPLLDWLRANHAPSRDL